jgi:hypothetical protein
MLDNFSLLSYKGTGFAGHALKIIHPTKSTTKTTKINAKGLLIKLSHIPDIPPFHIADSPDAMAIITPDEAASAEPDSSRKTFLM